MGCDVAADLGYLVGLAVEGALVPSGRLPAELPASAGAPPSSYLRSRLAGRHPGSLVDPAPLFAFGHGLSYTSFAYSDLAIEPRVVGMEPGEIGVAVGGSSDRLPLRGSLTLARPERAVGPDRVLDIPSTSCPSPPGPRPA